MGIYKNDYSKDEDYVLWNLHEIRSRMARKGLKCSAINKSARAIIRQYRLSKLKIKRIIS